MKAFWWFKDNSVAGMARPGLNAIHFFDLSFNEAAILGWLGQYSCGEVPLQTYRDHLVTYIPRTFVFHNLDEAAGAKVVEGLRQTNVITESLEKMNTRVKFFDYFEIRDDKLHFKRNKSRLIEDIEFLRKNEISKIVSLTEKHHDREELSQYFETYHISIEDMRAPKIEQVHELAEIIKASRLNNERLAVHCLAGIGRTSTMIVGAHVLLGERLEDLKAEIKKRNPKYALTGSQAEFLESLQK